MKTMIKVIALAAVLTGCVNTKLVPQYVFPSPPADLMVPGAPLKQIQKPKPPEAPVPGEKSAGSN